MTVEAVATVPTPNPIPVRREIEDIEALIDSAGGSAYVYGKSSGASLALQAAAALGDKVKKLALYEAPYSDAKAPPRNGKSSGRKLDGSSPQTVAPMPSRCS